MIAYLFVRIFIEFFRVLPFWIIHSITGVLQFILRYLVRYRYKTTIDNLKRCFPLYSNKQIEAIALDSYKNLATIFLEGLKGLTLNGDEIKKRNKFIGVEQVQSLLNSNKSLILVCPHYYNWEWIVLSSGYYFPNRMIGIYKEIRNAFLEKYIYSLRARCSMQLISTRQTRQIAEEIPKGRAILLMSDQAPSNTRDAVQSMFFGQLLPVLHGLEKYAHEYNLPVFYLDMSLVKPGYYEVKITELTSSVLSLARGELTQKYMNKVEECIRRNPAPWLWSHRRWKHLKL